jgi:hypothetical protein
LTAGQLQIRRIAPAEHGIRREAAAEYRRNRRYRRQGTSNSIR